MKEILISKTEEKTIIIIAENGNVVEKYEETEEQKRLEGGIYLGKVSDVLPGMQAAFVDIGETKNAFIHLKDLLPKLDVKTNNPEEIVNNSNIKDVVKTGKTLLIQVKRDSTNKKGARISTHISLPTRFLVFMPDTEIVTISKKIEDETEKNRLLEIVKKSLPQGCGAIVRTSAKGKKEEDIITDIKEIEKKWNEIKIKAENNNSKAPILICKNPGIIEKVLTDTIDQNIDKIIVDDDKIYDKVSKFVLDSKISIEKIETSVLEMYDIEKQLEKASNRKIWLKCGAYITIDKTEALTAIDVNSGKYTGKESFEKTVFRVNKEASIEIAKQLRLRDIDGIIIIDYIDMQEEENKKEIIRILEENLKNDRSKTQVVGFSKLNLLEMTRKHICSNE